MLVLPLVALFLSVAPSPSHQLPQMAAMGPIGRLDIKKVEECPKAESVLKLQFTKDDKGRRVFNAQLNLKEAYDKTYTFKVRVHKWTGSEFKRDMMKYEGKMCECVNKFIKAMRVNLYKLAGISGDCDIKPGNYAVKGIYGTEPQIKVPSVPYGTFQLEGQVFNSKKKPIACFVVDLDSIQKK